MAERWALFVAIDLYHDPKLGLQADAEQMAKSLALALVGAGYQKSNQVMLLGSHATKGAFESRVRKLRKAMKKDDSLLVWIDARAFSQKGSSVIAMWDTLADDLIDSGVSVSELFRDFESSKAGQVIYLLDVGTGTHQANFFPANAAPHLDSEQLNALFTSSPKSVCLTATLDEEASARTPALKASAWGHLVLEAVSGRLNKAISKTGAVTAVSLQRTIDDELPRVLRKQFDGRVVQSPRIFGEQNGAALIADLSAFVATQTGGGMLDAQRLKRIAFRSETFSRVKDLSGFRKTYKMPDYASPSSRKFIAKCAIDDVRADLNTVYEAVRLSLEYKRKDVDTSVGSDGFGSLRTPDFEYTVTATLDAEDPTQVVWQRDIVQLVDLAFVRSEGFEAAFGRMFDQLVFEFVNPVNVDDLVDRLEDAPIDGLKLNVDSDGTACEVSLAGFVGVVRVEKSLLVVRGRGGRTTGLLDQFLAFVTKVGPIGEPLGLPAK
jgi:hypothetical protein